MVVVVVVTMLTVMLGSGGVPGTAADDGRRRVLLVEVDVVRRLQDSDRRWDYVRGIFRGGDHAILCVYRFEQMVHHGYPLFYPLLPLTSSPSHPPCAAAVCGVAVFFRIPFRIEEGAEMGTTTPVLSSAITAMSADEPEEAVMNGLAVAVDGEEEEEIPVDAVGGTTEAVAEV